MLTKNADLRDRVREEVAFVIQQTASTPSNMVQRTSGPETRMTVYQRIAQSVVRDMCDLERNELLWTPVMAWLPVKTEDGTRHWLTVVERYRRTNHYRTIVRD